MAHGRFAVPGPDLVHLQFRRFAGCPVCNVHLRRFALAHADLSAAGVRTVSFFYSSQEAMLDYQHELPHPIVADPDRRFFDDFGVERSRWAAAHPRAWATALEGLLSGPTNPFEGEAQDGLPADFLIARSDARDARPQCEIVALHYGSSVDDQWSVEDLLGLAEVHTIPTELPHLSSTSTQGRART